MRAMWKNTALLWLECQGGAFCGRRLKRDQRRKQASTDFLLVEATALQNHGEQACSYSALHPLCEKRRHAADLAAALGAIWKVVGCFLAKQSSALPFFSDLLCLAIHAWPWSLGPPRQVCPYSVAEPVSLSSGPSPCRVVAENRSLLLLLLASELLGKA